MREFCDGPYREWADFLNDMKCGGPRDREEEKEEIKIGDRFRVRCYSDAEENWEIQTVDEKNIQFFLWNYNNPENDYWEIKRII